VDPTWDHYKGYFGYVPIPSRTVYLNDQFGRDTASTNIMEVLANPAEKQVPGGGVYPIFDSRLHYTWWLLNNRPVNIPVTVANQFGEQQLTLNLVTYLWNPALKNETGAVPLENHYKCYRCSGAPVNRQVTLRDQFGIQQTTATNPVYFCNPTEKIVPGQPPHPIVDPNQHYVCYDLSPTHSIQPTVNVTDQFVSNVSVQLFGGYYLCVPTAKVDPTPTRRDSWGRLKVLYR
jgi:hypothetical protein